MDTINYSVIIRTLGNAGEKYRLLLESVEKLEPKPAEVIVVLPEGYDLPKETLGWEKFFYSKKGMVYQRMEGVAQCSTKYALICDDDVMFDTDFVQKLYPPVRDGLCAFSAGPLYSFLPEPGIRSLLCTVMASAVPTILHRKTRYVSVLNSTGYSYNRHLKSGSFYEAQSLAWTCFFADVNALRRIDFSDELWLEKHGYTAMDDQTMFYKAWLRGMKTIVVADADYVHMDAKTSIRNNKSNVLYSCKFNRVVFWHRFILGGKRTLLGKSAARLAFVYRMTWERFLDALAVHRQKMTAADLKIAREGYLDAWRFVKSPEYKSLNPVAGVKQ